MEREELRERGYILLLFGYNHDCKVPSLTLRAVPLFCMKRFSPVKFMGVYPTLTIPLAPSYCEMYCMC